MSISDVEFNTAAIKIDSLSKKIETGVVYLPGKYHLGPSGKFINYPTSYQWITFQTGGDSGIISAKTSNPSNIYLEVAIMFRIREESLHDVYKKWPTKNFKRDFILFAKVYSNLSTDSYRMRFKKSPRISLITTSSQSGRRFPE